MLGAGLCTLASRNSEVLQVPGRTPVSKHSWLCALLLPPPVVPRHGRVNALLNGVRQLFRPAAYSLLRPSPPPWPGRMRTLPLTLRPSSAAIAWGTPSRPYLAGGDQTEGLEYLYCRQAARN